MSSINHGLSISNGAGATEPIARVAHGAAGIGGEYDGGAVDHAEAYQLPPTARPVPQRSAAATSARLLERVMAELSATFALVVSMLPRGVLIATVAAVPANGIARNYTRTTDRIDRASWKLMSARRPIQVGDMANASHRRAVEPILRRAFGGPVDDAIVITVDAPAVPGYPGAVIAGRGQGQGSFDPSAARGLADLVAAFQRERAAAVAARMERELPRADLLRTIRRLTPFRGVSVLDPAGELVFAGAPAAGDGAGDDDAKPIDAALRRQMSDVARAVAAGDEDVITRWVGRRSDGLLVPFRVVRHGPAASARGDGNGHGHGNGDADALGTTVWFARTPTPAEFEAIDPADLAAEPEMVRLLPALRFMRESYTATPPLDQIARQVHLSPFHFHRRFTDLIGVTPKHFLLDCQVERAQRELLSDRLTLAQIAGACGFSHQSHFTSRFKQAVGLTPVQWRKRAMQA